MKNIKDIDVKNKSVIVRCDFNVPIKNNTIADASRIQKSIPTILYLLDNNCKIVLLSHMGRIKSETDKCKYSLKMVAEYLSGLLHKKVIFVSECYGNKVKEIVTNANNGDIILLENTRYMDYPNKLESGNNLKLAEFWASLGDIFILDAFGSCHRAHASTAGIAKYIPNGIGLLVAEELRNLKDLINIKERPFTIFMGGAKVEDKLPIIKKLLPKCDYLLLGGGIANSFLKANGMNVGTSLSTDDNDMLMELRQLLETYGDKIVLPVDFVYDNTAIMDLGKESIQKYAEYINKSKLVFMNGTPGKFEDDLYSAGTESLLNILVNSSCKIIAGGGDTINALKKYNMEGRFYFESSGGGATLEYIANGDLEAFRWLN